MFWSDTGVLLQGIKTKYHREDECCLSVAEKSRLGTNADSQWILTCSVDLEEQIPIEWAGLSIETTDNELTAVPLANDKVLITVNLSLPGKVKHFFVLQCLL